ncbi:hypothetical protein K8I61_00340 [bacterium]|nr:hypothetical protein [bacterium]
MTDVRFRKYLGPVSEAMSVLDSPGVPRGGYCYLSVRGRVDLDALQAALDEIVRIFPGLNCRLSEEQAGLRHKLARVPLDTPPRVRVVDIAEPGEKPLGRFDALRRAFEPEYLTPMDLFAESSFRLYLARFSDGYDAIVFYFHHVGSDAGTMFPLIRILLARYHQTLTGEHPAWADTEDMVSTGRAAPAASLRHSIVEMARESRLHKKHPIIRYTPPTRVTSSRRHVAYILLDKNETRLLRDRAKAAGATVNDFVCVSIARIMDEDLGTPPGTHSIWIPVNVRTDADVRDWRMNYSTSINVELTRDERLDERTMTGLFVARRKRATETGRAYANLRMLGWLLYFMSFLPYAKRAPKLHKLFSQPMTFMLSNVGVLWPRRVDGRVTSDSEITRAANLEILDYMVNFAVDDNMGHGFVAYTFDSRFFVAFSVYTDVMTQLAADAFVNRIRARLLGKS